MVNKVMRRLGDAQLVLRLEAFSVVVANCEIMIGECDFVTNLSVCVCVFFIS